MGKGTIKECSALMDQGKHQFYEGTHGRLWKFWIVMEDGKQGILEKKKTEVPFKAGDKVTYDERPIGDRGNVKYTNMKIFTEEKHAGYSGSSTGRSYNDPRVTLPMAMSMARSLFIKLVKLRDVKGKMTKKDMTNYSMLFYNWITMAETERDRDILSRRWYALEQAIDCVEFPLFELEPDVNGKGDVIKPQRDKILELAEIFFKETMAVVEEEEDGQD